jgi:hypothetical protein
MPPRIKVGNVCSVSGIVKHVRREIMTQNIKSWHACRHTLQKPWLYP